MPLCYLHTISLTLPYYQYSTNPSLTVIDIVRYTNIITSFITLLFCIVISLMITLSISISFYLQLYDYIKTLLMIKIPKYYQSLYAYFLHLANLAWEYLSITSSRHHWCFSSCASYRHPFVYVKNLYEIYSDLKDKSTKK